MIRKSFSIQKTVDVCFSQELHSEIDEVFYLFHGYAQLPEYFIRHFERFFRPNRLFVAPQGPSTLYIQGTSGRVGASWMTKHNRLNDIADINGYLNYLHESIKAHISPRATFNTLSFSQGCAVTLRWLYQSSLKPKNIFIWGGTLPHDLPLELQREKLAASQLHIVNGVNDPYLKDELHSGEIRRLFEDNHIPFEWHTFEGGHHLDAETLERLIGIETSF